MNSTSEIFLALAKSAERREEVQVSAAAGQVEIRLDDVAVLPPDEAQRFHDDLKNHYNQSNQSEQVDEVLRALSESIDEVRTARPE